MAVDLKRVRKLLKDPYWLGKSAYAKYYDKLPIDDKVILLESQHGKEFNGNIFRIAQYLGTDPQYQDYKIYLFCRPGNLAIVKKKWSCTASPM